MQQGVTAIDQLDNEMVHMAKNPTEQKIEPVKEKYNVLELYSKLHQCNTVITQLHRDSANYKAEAVLPGATAALEDLRRNQPKPIGSEQQEID